MKLWIILTVVCLGFLFLIDHLFEHSEPGVVMLVVEKDTYNASGASMEKPFVIQITNLEGKTIKANIPSPVNTHGAAMVGNPGLLRHGFWVEIVTPTGKTETAFRRPRKSAGMVVVYSVKDGNPEIRTDRFNDPPGRPLGAKIQVRSRH